MPTAMAATVIATTTAQRGGSTRSSILSDTAATGESNSFWVANFANSLDLKTEKFKKLNFVF